MAELDYALRLIIIGQYSLLLALLMLSVGVYRSRSMLALGLAACGYVLTSSTLLMQQLGPAQPVVLLAALGAAWLFWFFVRAVFELNLAWHWVALGAGLTLLPSWLVFSNIVTAATAVGDSINTAREVFSLLLVGHALYALGKSQQDDLLPQRRQLRLQLSWVTALTIGGIISYEILLPGQAPPWLTAAVMALIALLTLWLGSQFAIHHRDLLPDRSYRKKPGGSTTSVPQSVKTKPILAALDAAMGSGLYREAGLTIGALAQHLAIPEHQLRQVINQELGYRNFSAYINQYRIDAICTLLRDPAQARLPILTLALDNGFGSLGPFNKAFKQVTGTTPSAYRQQALLDSEKP